MTNDSNQGVALRRSGTLGRSRFLSALCGVIGPVILVASFVINPAPPSDYTPTQLQAFALRHHNGIVLGGWLQGMGSLNA